VVRHQATNLAHPLHRVVALDEHQTGCVCIGG
jgi:hypothetical protein